jgi:hypothetical protein
MNRIRCCRCEAIEGVMVTGAWQCWHCLAVVCPGCAGDAYAQARDADAASLRCPRCRGYGMGRLFASRRDEDDRGGELSGSSAAGSRDAPVGDRDVDRGGAGQDQAGAAAPAPGA